MENSNCLYHIITSFYPYYSKKINLDYIKIIILFLTIVFAYQLLRNKFLKILQSYTVTYNYFFNIIRIFSSYHRCFS